MQPDPTNVSLDSVAKEDTSARVTTAEMDDDSDFEGFDSDEDDIQPQLLKGGASESVKATCDLLVHSSMRTTAADGCPSQTTVLSLSDDDGFDGFDSDD